MSDICIPLYIASMKEAYQLELNTIKTIPKVRGKQALWAEENESKQECLKVGLFTEYETFNREEKKKDKTNTKSQLLKSRAKAHLFLWDFTFFDTS